MADRSLTPDYFEPNPRFCCPICGTTLSQWKSGDGPCKGFIWQEHVAEPGLELVPETSEEENEQLRQQRLQDDFHAETTCPDCAGGALRVQLRGTVREGIWVDSQVSEVKDLQSGRLYYSIYD